MREILFRGKRTHDNEWTIGSLHIEKFIEDEEYICCEINQCDVHPETVGQYTGLTDKNGTKIFEGDIGRYQQTDGARQNNKPIICIGKVIYNAKTASFAVESKDEKGFKYFDYFPVKDFEIIGNIHDNPELLKGVAEL